MEYFRFSIWAAESLGMLMNGFLSETAFGVYAEFY
jgi:hypothetical protein